MIHDLMLRWVVTGLFALPAAECGLAIAARLRPWTWVVNHGLHFVMAVGMAVMAWPWGARLPATGPAVFFLLAAAWFVTMAVVAAQATGVRGLYGYHGLMMLATAWMYVVMDGHLLPGSSSAQHATGHGGSMPGMDMAAMDMLASDGSPLWFSAVNWFGVVGLAVAAVVWTFRYFTQRHEAAGSRSLGNLGQAMMAAGMSILFVATLFRV
ncbi:DUF5134 domain-containing protein [Mycobacterium shinjukuense]|nr:DUF5134 domain-containing protein [Mycobacterium shinjukuense]MCV6984997.1 DUF5134 domain-containing protein [Mycobacterium shinjukuense]ORB69350.1 DUF5134 domain-containing protein [Mycobacterium shinjukuense]